MMLYNGLEKSRFWRRLISGQLGDLDRLYSCAPLFLVAFTPNWSSQLRSVPTSIDISLTLLLPSLIFSFISFLFYQFPFVSPSRVHGVATRAVRVRPSCQFPKGGVDIP